MTTRPPPRRLALTLFVLVTISAPPQLEAYDYQTRRLTDAQGVGILAPAFSAEGEWLLHLRTNPAQSALELYSSRRWEGSTTTRLSLDHTAGSGVVLFETTPDERRVVFSFLGDSSGALSLQSAELRGAAGSSVTLVTIPVSATSFRFEISPDSTCVLVVTDLTAPGVFELWTVAIDGSGPPVRLNPPLAPDEGIHLFQYSPDGSRVVFPVNGATSTSLWSAPVDGSAPATRLSPPTGLSGLLFQAGVVTNLAIFGGDFIAGDGGELWSSLLDGSQPPVRISPPVPEAIQYLPFSPSSGGARTVFRADMAGTGVHELFRASNSGPPAATIRLSGELSTSETLWTHRLDPESGRALYGITTGSWPVEALYSVPIVGFPPQPVVLTPPAIGGDTPSIYEFRGTPGGSRVLFEMSRAIDQTTLWSVPVDGPASSAVRLTPGLPDAALHTGPEPIPATASHALFVLHRNPSISELWSARLDGSAGALRLHDAPPAGGGVIAQAVRLAPLAGRVYFYGDLVESQRYELWVAPIGGPETEAERLHPVPTADGDFSGAFAVAPDGRGVLFSGDLETDEIYDLWIADEMIFGADFDEEGDLSEWSVSVP